MASTTPQPLPRMLATDEILPAIQRIISDRESVRNLVVRQVLPETATFENVILPWLQEEDLNQGTEAVIDMYRYAAPQQEARDAAEEATRRMSDSRARLALRQDLFLLVKAVADKDDAPDEESRKAVTDMLREYTNVGHGKLNQEQIGELLETRSQIDKLCQDFNRNLRETKEGAWFTAEELDGVPADEFRRLSGGTDKAYVDFGNFSDRMVVMRNARDPDTRQRLYLANIQKLQENVDIFKKVVVLRDTNARLLGFKSHAEFRLQDRIAPSTDWVDNTLTLLREQTIPLGQEVMQKLMAKKREDLGIGAGSQSDQFFAWDFFYYMRMLEQEHSVDQDLISEYFPLSHTVLAMLEVFESFLQLRFQKIPQEQIRGEIWHDDVEAWSVWDDREGHSGEFIGYLFADILYRSGKYKGNQNVNLQASFLKPGHGRILPATILMCNFSPSSSVGCPLLRHSQVVTLFHELGHGIHDLLSRTSHTRYHAWRVPVEFGEALSTMLENWCWNETELKKMSCHYTHLGPEYLHRWLAQHPDMTPPASTLPDGLLDQLIAGRRRDDITRLQQQLTDSTFDITVHNPATHQDAVQLDETKLYNSIKEEITMLINPNPQTWGPAHCHYGHLMSGYDAGYYAYISAQIFAADFYDTAFAVDPRNPETWDRYRRIILEAGGSRDEAKLMEEFLQRPPSIDALVRSLGGTGSSK